VNDGGVFNLVWEAMITGSCSPRWGDFNGDGRLDIVGSGWHGGQGCKLAVWLTD
jgi:hypothetical protein